MAGTKKGAAKLAATLKQRYGEDYYKRIGAVGGKRGRSGGFAYKIECNCSVYEGPHYKANCAGRKGGLAGRNKEVYNESN